MRMSARPTTTGETARGRSMSALRMRLPRNWWRTSSRATPTPKTVLAITVKKATMAVISNAWTVDGSERASHTGPRPWANVRHVTNQSGMTRRRARYPRATTRSVPRDRLLRVAVAEAALGTSGPPPLQHVQGDEDHQRDDEEHGGDGGGAGRVVRLDLTEDVHGRDLGLEGQVARDEHGRAELADGSGEGEGGAGGHGGKQIREDDPPEDREVARAERRRCLLPLRI